MGMKGISQKVGLWGAAEGITIHPKRGPARGCAVGPGTEGWTRHRIQGTEGFVFLIQDFHPPTFIQVEELARKSEMGTQ